MRSPARPVPRGRGALRRALTAPFVVTVALGAGCGPRQEQETTPPPGVVTNPPPPDGSGAGEGGPGATGTGGGSELPEAPTSGGTVQRGDDGSCYFHADGPDCPPNAACNPPPPQRVECPPEEPTGR